MKELATIPIKDTGIKSCCEVVEASCWCIEEEGHDGLHKCKCGGSWKFDEDGRFCITTIPGSRDFRFGAFPLSDMDRDVLKRGKKDKRDKRN